MNAVNTTIIRQATIKDAIPIRAVLTASQWFTYQKLIFKGIYRKNDRSILQLGTY